jgi:NAD(P)-dependent dehydrogenase (short-subunit alcohol dehydrogenase family)
LQSASDRLENSVHTPASILVTGASSGFGALTVRTLARQGHTVFAGMRQPTGHNAPAARELTTLAARAGLAVHVLELDVTHEAGVESAVHQVVQAAGRLDVVVNNAGVLYTGPLEAFTLDQVYAQFDVNVFGVLRVNRAALPYMRAQRAGLLVQVGSITGRIAFPFAGLYAASKFALEGLTEAARLELADAGIDVAIVEPGTYPTPLAAKRVLAADARRLAAYPAAAGGRTPISQQLQAALLSADGGALDPQEVAAAIAALIAMPAGTRPLRTVVATPAQRRGAEILNAASDQVIRGVMQATGAAAPSTPPHDQGIA